MSPKRLASFFVSPELDEGLNRLKAKTGAAKGEIIRRALEEYLTTHGAMADSDRARVEPSGAVDALRRYHEAIRQGLVAQNRAAHMRLLGERRAGALLLAVPMQQGRGKKGEGFRTMLAQSHIPEEDARRWQAFAKVPEATFAELVASCNQSGDELTTILAVAMAQSYLDRQPENDEDIPEPQPDQTRPKARKQARRRK
jgi:Ribbon-helix-helix protein, copG family